MHADKLLRLADFLQNDVKDDWFNLNHFADWGFNEKKCGTTACALGWASQVPEWQGVITLVESKLIGEVNVCYNDYRNFDAGEKFFDIDDEACSYLFYPAKYVDTGKQAVIDRILFFVKNEGKIMDDGNMGDYYYDEENDDDDEFLYDDDEDCDDFDNEDDYEEDD